MSNSYRPPSSKKGIQTGRGTGLIPRMTKGMQNLLREGDSGVSCFIWENKA